MRSKDSPHLYEILRNAARPSPEAAPAAAAEPKPAAGGDGPQPTLQERLAAYKAAKLGPAPEPATLASVAVSTETPPPVEAPKPAELVPPKLRPLTMTLPASAPSVSSVANRPAPGERVLRVTYNTAVFAGLVGLGLLFIAYSLGVRSGRAQTADASPLPASATAVTVTHEGEAPPPKPPILGPVPPPPPPPKVYTIRLAEAPFRTSQERLKADALAHEVKAALGRAGMTGVEKAEILRGGEKFLMIYLGKFQDIRAEGSKSKLVAIQKVKVNGQAMAGAAFEEMPR
jgi:hypothetical protein